MLVLDAWAVVHSPLLVMNMDGWETCGIFLLNLLNQSYQNDGLVIMKVVCNEILLTIEKIPALTGLELGTARSVFLRITYYSTGAPMVMYRLNELSIS